MNRKIFLSNLTVRSVLGSLLILTMSLNLNAKVMARRIHLAGLVVNAGTLSPVAMADIYSSDKKLLGTTDKNGYYSVNIDCNAKGAMQFSITISKEGYESLLDKENWGDLGNTSKMIIYFGIRESKSNAEQFSKFGNDAGSGNLSYNNVFAGFTKVQEQKNFDRELAKAKEGNENVLIQYNDNFYIVNDFGWIQINSDQDLISINDKKNIVASQLNATVKRKDIKGMTPVESKDAKFAIYTK